MSSNSNKTTNAATTQSRVDSSTKKLASLNLNLDLQQPTARSRHFIIYEDPIEAAVQDNEEEMGTTHREENRFEDDCKENVRPAELNEAPSEVQDQPRLNSVGGHRVAGNGLGTVPVAGRRPLGDITGFVNAEERRNVKGNRC